MRKAAALLLLVCGAARAQGPELALDVDLREAPRRLVHAHLRIPARAGQLALAYPKWIPGEHGPNGPVVDLAGLVFTARGQRLAWRRDPLDLYRLIVEVPEGESEIEAQLDFLSPPPGSSGFSEGASATAHLAVLSWHQVLLYPYGAAARDVRMRATVHVPARWKIATSLPIDGAPGETTRFAPVSLEQLVDSPVLTGEHLHEIPIGPQGSAPHFVELAAESEDVTHVDPEMKAHWDALIAQAQLLFGAHHYNSYRFLLTLSDSTAHFGLEHHQSSDDRVPERSLLDWELRLTRLSGLLPHEYTHSWNGKYRRPAGLATPDYQTPMKGELLWVYEGLTNFVGNVLAARSGLYTPEQYREYLAFVADLMQQHRGRTWRPLADTAVAAQVLYGAREDWDAWRRDVDFYDEGDLLWLDADTLIREKTSGAKSIDDFCKLFYGGKDTPPEVRPYTLDDVVAALSQVARLDWGGFVRARVFAIEPDAPFAGIERSGWKLAYAPEPTEWIRAYEKARRLVDLRASIGLLLEDEHEPNKIGILDVVPTSAADKAGVAPGTRLVAVNGRRATADRVRTAVAETARGGKLELLVENADSFTTHALQYTGGLRYPRLVRDDSRPDTLSRILAPVGDAARR
jgi:predicted metalloprotease with PDZ domain